VVHVQAAQVLCRQSQVLGGACCAPLMSSWSAFCTQLVVVAGIDVSLVVCALPFVPFKHTFVGNQQPSF